jgi:hypothetical protein
MRATLIDWLLQVHVRYHMLPETLWIAVNIIDRFLSNRVVSLVKLQLVGVTAMFIAAKYEEIMAPRCAAVRALCHAPLSPAHSVEEFVYMTENGYTREEILKGERIILQVRRSYGCFRPPPSLTCDAQSLEFNISSYCSPYSWVRRISKADDYDTQTRTLSKFLMEVTLLDHRFLRAKASMIAAIGMYVARKMLGGEWVRAVALLSRSLPNLCPHRKRPLSTTLATPPSSSSAHASSSWRTSSPPTLRTASSTRSTPTRRCARVTSSCRGRC